MRVLLGYISAPALFLAFPRLEHITFDSTPRAYFDALMSEGWCFADRDQFPMRMETKYQVEQQLNAFMQCPQVRVEGLYIRQIPDCLGQGLMRGLWPDVDVEIILRETKDIDPAKSRGIWQYGCDLYKSEQKAAQDPDDAFAGPPRRRSDVVENFLSNALSRPQKRLK